MNHATRILAALALLILAPTTLAQSIEADARISWTLPTLAEDGTPLTGSQALTGVEVYLSTAPIEDGAPAPRIAQLPPTVTTFTWRGNVANGDTIYVRLKACNAGGCGRYSGQVDRRFLLSVPGVPEGVTLSVTVAVGIKQ